MIYVLEGMPQEWAALTKFYSSLSNDEVPIFSLVYQDKFYNTDFYRLVPSIEGKQLQISNSCGFQPECLQPDDSLVGNSIVQFEIMTERIDTLAYDINYQNYFYSEVSPLEDWKKFQQIVLRHISDLVYNIDRRNILLQHKFYFLNIPEFNDVINKVIKNTKLCKLGFATVKSISAAMEIERTQRLMDNQFINHFMDYLPLYSISLPHFSIPHFQYIDIDISKEGLISLK